MKKNDTGEYMEKRDLLDLIKEMSLSEKAMQMTQLAAGHICHTALANLTGPFRQWSFTDEELEQTGSILGSHGAEYVMKIQKDYLEKSRHKIPLMFMQDVIHGFKTIFPIPLAQGCSFNRGSGVCDGEGSVSGRSPCNFFPDGGSGERSPLGTCDGVPGRRFLSGR